MRREQRSLQVWSLLVCAARDRRTYTYGGIATALGMAPQAAIAVPNFLGPIMHYCRQRELPPLTVLVVNHETGAPGEGLTTIEDVNRDREWVFANNWFELEPPESGNFREAWDRRHQ